MASVAQPKVRSRKDGSAIPLDDTDRKLLNLMQGSFDLVPRPFAHVAKLAEIDEADVMQRVQRLLDGRIIREITPIFDTRALGYSSMLVAAKVDPEYPHRAAKFINTHPGVTHNYLRNHDFNLWFTLATEPGSELGLQGTLDVIAEKTGAESIRQLPTLKLFKIRMDLEMEKGTEALATSGEAVEPRELDPIELSDEDVAVIRATQGPMPVIEEPYAPRRRAARRQPGRGDRAARVAARAQRPAPRRRDPLPPPRGLLRQRHGRVGGAGGRDPRHRPAHGRVPRHLALLPAPDLRGLAVLGVHDGPRPLQGGVRRGARRDRRADRHHRPRDAVLEHRVQEGPDALLHRRVPRLGARELLTASLTDTRSAELYRRALRVLPGGVNSPVRAMRSIGRDPVFVERAEGAELTDVDGNTYVDYVCSWGPLIHGHAFPPVLAAVAAAAEKGTTFGAPTAAEVELAEEVARRVPSVEMLRMTSSGTEASMSAIRLARAATGRDTLIKFAGAYHGHVDGLLAEAGSGLATQGIPASPGVPEAAAAATIVVPWNDPEAITAAVKQHEPAAILAEPYPANMGLVPPQPGFLELLRELATDSGALLVFDEVISGFRVSTGGAQELCGVLPDLTVMGKVIGGGLPAAAYGGPVELLERIAPAGDVYQAGTLSGNPLAVAAGLATLQALDEESYLQLAETTRSLAAGLREAAGSRPVQVAETTGLLTVFFSAEPVTDYAGAAGCDTEAHAAWCRALLARGVYPPPSQFEAWFPSLAHTSEHVERTVEAAAAAFGEIA